MKLIEIMLWIVGATLLAMFAGAQAWGEIERQRDVATFGQAQQQLASLSDAVQTLPQNALGIGVHETDALAFDIGTASGQNALWTESTDDVLAILRIPGIALEVPVNYGTDEWVLLRGAGLVEGTAWPGSNGNVAIAAHRDTHFRPLKDLVVGDRIELVLLDRTKSYVVTTLSVVEPTDVHVLADTGDAVLTLVTCYPFYFVGHAPQRFIVRAVATDFSD